MAILLVIGRHVQAASGGDSWVTPIALVWRRIGWTGVDLFFVLSGFLVGGLLFKELRTHDRVDVRRFLFRRGFKIWPSYYVFLACYFLKYALVDAHGDFRAALARVLPGIFHLQNYFPNPRHTWSLAIEEHFYLVVPIAVGIALRVGPRERPLRFIPVVAAIVAAVCLALRLSLFDHPYSPGVHVFPTHLRVDGLFFGVFLGYLHHFDSPILRRVGARSLPLLAVGIALVAPMGFLELETSPFVYTIGFTMLYLGYGAIVVACAHAPRDGWLRRLFETPVARLLGAVGFFSYPIYLWHLDLGITPVTKLFQHGYLRHYPALEWLSQATLSVVAAVVAGIVMSKIVEQPMLRLRDRLFPSRSGAVR